ncbi:sulfotransferase family 2 domain-containing protein [Alkalihalobacterium elongatum]|uniref:sulfotransferase family 2 domain-containing protein n=1 Tax=Alkalihalobacterium elongatum TaxID=2675466 RepID=UPI001C1F8F06|nr:sulfotransferase family 2 domain-containing protein [Alkalihalobacterium elongatum]
MYTHEVLIFMHIPKTAGTSLSLVLKKQFKPHEIVRVDGPVKDTKYFNAQTKCIMGHHVFGYHKISSKERYITMLRDPVDRVISSYYHHIERVKRGWETDIGSKIINENMDLQDFLNCKESRFKLETENLMVHYCSGGSSTDLTKAKENLEKYFVVIGINEMFDESLKLMQKKLNWNDISYKNANITKNRPKLSEVPKNIIQKINEMNSLDLQLYSWVKKKLEDELNNINN